MNKYLFILAAGLTFSLSDGQGQWGPRGCAQQVLLSSPTIQYRWEAHEQKGLYLFANNVQVGYHDLEEDCYTPYDALTKRWGKAGSTPPIELPVEYRRKKAEESLPTGVVSEKLSGREVYSINGREVTKDDVTGLLLPHQASLNVPDDKLKMRVTVIGSESDRKKVLTDWKKDARFADFRETCIVQDYDPSNWTVQAGFVTSGKPTIYVQAPSGKVLHRQDDYDDGAEGLAGALRQVNPNYKPDLDLDLRKRLPLNPAPLIPPLLPQLDIPWDWLLVLVAAGILLFLYLRNRKAE